jgi:hypothetical protein
VSSVVPVHTGEAFWTDHGPLFSPSDIAQTDESMESKINDLKKFRVFWSRPIGKHALPIIASLSWTPGTDRIWRD